MCHLVFAKKDALSVTSCEPEDLIKTLQKYYADGYLLTHFKCSGPI